MKKRFFTTIGLVVFTSFVLSACGNKDAASSEETPEAVKTGEAEQPAVPAASAESSGIPECDEYTKAFEKYMACDNVPEASKQAAKQGIDAMKTSWASLKDSPDEAKKAAADSCKTAHDGLKQGATALECEI